MQLKYFMGMSVLALSAGMPLPAWTAAPEPEPGMADRELQGEAALSGQAEQAEALTAVERILAAHPLVIARDATAQARANDTFEAPVAQDQLDHLRGGTDTVSNNANLNGVVTNNTAINVNTGSNIIDGGAFANSAGVPIVVQNSGSNVLIQNSTIINLQLK